MTIEGLLNALRVRGVRISVDGDRLIVDAPAGAMTAELQHAVREHKAKLLRLIGETGSVADPIPRLAPGEPAPLSRAQQRIWLFQQLDAKSTTYNLTPTVRLTGPLDDGRLRSALETLVLRHPPLRTLIKPTSSGAVQQVVPSPTELLVIEDVRHVPADETTGAVAAIILREKRRPFLLSREIPFRAVLIRRAEQVADLVVSFHHIAADGQSMSIFFGELFKLYDGQELASLPIDYADYAAWEARRWDGERLSRELSYWRSHLLGAPTELELPTDRSRPPLQTFTGGVVWRVLDKPSSARLESLYRQEGATLFMALLAAYAAALHRHSGQRDLVIGTPVDGRTRPEVVGLVGMFVNQLALRIRVGRQDTFRDLLRRAHETSREGLARQDFPFPSLVDALNLPRDRSRTPLFQAMLNVLPPQPASPVVRAAAGVEFSLPQAAELTASFDGQAKFDLTLYARQGAETGLGLVYNRDLFNEERIARLLDDVENVLRRGAAEPDRPMAELFSLDGGLPCAAEAGRGSVKSVVESVPQRFARTVANGPDRVALLGGSAETTYCGVEMRVRQLSKSIRAAADTIERPVGVLVEHGEDAVVAILAALWIGKPYVPLDPAFPEARLRFMAVDSGMDVVIASSASRARAEELFDAPIVVVNQFDADESGGGGQVEADGYAGSPAAATPDSVAYMLYTSGSTGQPKAVVQSHRGLVEQADRYARALSLGPGDRVALTASISFDAFLMDAFGALLNGAALSPLDLRALDFGKLPAEIESRRLTVLHMTPTVFRALARTNPNESLPTVRALVLGGEPVRAEDVQSFDRLFASDSLLLNLYGASEHSFSFAFAIPRETHRSSKEIPIGFPVGDVEPVLLDDDGEEDPVRGELAIRSSDGMLGYWRRADLEAAAFAADKSRPGAKLFRTGDIVRRRYDGAYVFLHRKDRQLKIRGQRIEPQEVEAAITAHPSVAEAAVRAAPDALGDPALTAVVAFNAGAAEIADVARWCRARLPEGMVPSEWVVVERLPRTPTGKIDRRSLPASERAEAPTESPRTAHEELVAAVFAGLLGIPNVNRKDSFFALGGHSLLAMQAVARLNDKAGVELDLRALFDHPTPADLGEFIGRSLESGGLAAPPLERQTVPAGGIPLSFAQERLWFLQQLAPESGAYNLAGALELGGALDVSALRQALDRIALRHEVLRAVIGVMDGRPVLQISPQPRHVLEELTVSPADDLHSVLAARIAEPFDLERGPLLRAVLLTLASERHVLLLVSHHVISDGWSMGIFSHELGEQYRSIVAGREAVLPRLPIQYSDFAIWQRQWLRGEELEQQLDYWRRELAGANPMLPLPTDRPRPPVANYRGARLDFALPPALHDELLAFSRREGATLFMTLLAAFQLLLARYSGQQDLQVGSPVANRGRTELEGLIGFFVNTLVLRVDVSGARHFADLVGSVRRSCLGAYAHQDVPFAKLVQELQIDRDPGRNPFFQVMFTFQNAAAPKLHLGDLTVNPVSLERSTAQVDLTLYMRSTEEGLRGTIEYAADLFDAETIERMGEHYEGLLRAAVAGPREALSRLRLLDAKGRAEAVSRWNATFAEYPRDRTLVEEIAEQSGKHFSKVAIGYGGLELTYGELERSSNRLARHLKAVGVVADQPVGLCVERGFDMVVGMLGIMKAGGAYVPLDPGFPGERLRYMLEDSGAQVLLTHSGLGEELFAGLKIERVRLDADREAIERQSGEALEGVLSGEHRAYVIYTSGSTGRPKGVEIEHGALLNFLYSMRREPGLEEGDVLLAVTTMSFDIAGLELWLPLVSGARVELVSRETALDAGELARAMKGSGATVMQATPATWRMLLDWGWGGDDGLKVLCGGEAMGRDLAQRLLGKCGELWNLYGPTETTIWSTVGRIEKAEDLTIGRPIANTRVYVLDAEKEPVPRGVVGELWIGGEGVARGYLRRETLTSERFVEDPFHGGRMYRTGDLGRYLPDGRLECLGRTDGQVKMRGYRIELGEIESVLGEHAEVSECAVVVRELSDDRRLVAYVAGGGDAAAYREHLRKRLPEYMVPSTYVELEALPRTPNNKIDRNALPMPEGVFARAYRNYVEPRKGVEQLLASIWCEVLNVDRVGSDDNFFDLGGHSLLAVRVLSRVHAAMKIRLPLHLVFEKPSIAELAQYIETVLWAGQGRPSETLKHSEEFEEECF